MADKAATPVNVTPVRPSAARPSAWRIEQRAGSGQYIVSERGALLFRVDRASGTLWAWDKKLGGEVPVKLSELLALCA